MNECRTAADRESTETRQCSGNPVPLAREQAHQSARRQPLAHYRDTREIGRRRTSPCRSLFDRSTAPPTKCRSVIEARIERVAETVADQADRQHREKN